MDELIKHLKTLESFNFVSTSRFLNSYDSKNSFKKAFIRYKLNKILTLCDELLITSHGSCDYYNIAILENNGYRVGPGEIDRFGWLSGILYTKKGCILYG
jgi:hypothetical protein